MVKCLLVHVPNSEFKDIYDELAAFPTAVLY